jgi:hypothetical protein
MKRIVVALVVGGVVFGGALAMAASLGGVQVDNLGASAQVIAACDTNGVIAEFEFAHDNGDVRIHNVIVVGVSAACEDQYVEVFLYDALGTLRASGGLELSDEEMANNSHVVRTRSFGLDAPDPRVEDITKIVIMISG